MRSRLWRATAARFELHGVDCMLHAGMTRTGRHVWKTQ